jgi:hypothetical protein
VAHPGGQDAQAPLLQVCPAEQQLDPQAVVPLLQQVPLAHWPLAQHTSSHGTPLGQATQASFWQISR